MDECYKIFEVSISTKPPDLDLMYIKQLVKDNFGLQVLNMEILNSYDDLNFLLKIADENNKGFDKIKCVLKVLNSHDSKNGNIILSQNKMMEYLCHHGLNVSKPIINIHGSTIMYKFFSDFDSSKSNEKTEYLVRLLTFAEGEMISSVPYTPNLMYQLGNYIAKVNMLLKDFKDNVLKDRGKYRWRMECLPDFKTKTIIINDANKKQLVDEVISKWSTQVMPHFNELEKGFIHGDLNGENILVMSNDKMAYNISGLIDFGDTCYSPYIFELAIAITYMMADSPILVRLDLPGYIIAGYQKIRPLPQIEWDVLLECICARCVQSIIIGAYCCSTESESKRKSLYGYKMWSVLNELWGNSKNELVRRWKKNAVEFSV